MAYSLKPTLVSQRSEIGCTRIDLANPYYAGADIGRAQAIHSKIAAANQPGAPSDRAALNVIRALIDDDDAQAIGGAVQLGYTVGQDFMRASTVRPVPGEEPRAAMWLNGIQTDKLPVVGPCRIGMQGMVSPLAGHKPDWAVPLGSAAAATDHVVGRKRFALT